MLLTGKFGLGFNTVYNVTDVPSFVSRDSIVIFDPHTKHLGRAIRDRSKPGMSCVSTFVDSTLMSTSKTFLQYSSVVSSSLNRVAELAQSHGLIVCQNDGGAVSLLDRVSERWWCTLTA